MNHTGDTARMGLARWLPVALLGLVLGGCGGLPRSDSPARVEDRGSQPTAPATAASQPQIAAYTPPAQPQVARAEPKRAVSVLTRRAEDQRRAGDLDGATASLERALRIAPEDAWLWHRLAAVRAAQQRHDLVVQLAAKSNALAVPGDRELLGGNWQLIADARRALGDGNGAREAQRRADTYR